MTGNPFDLLISHSPVVVLSRDGDPVASVPLVALIACALVIALVWSIASRHVTAEAL